MPKKTTSTRSGAQRNRPKVQKNIELVRQVPVEQELEDTSKAEPAAVSTPPSGPRGKGPRGRNG